MRPFARVIRVSGVAASVAAACVWLAGCSEAARLEARCSTGNVPVCVQLGDMYATGKRVPRDLGRAARAYSRACDGGAADVCNILGEIVEQTGAVEGGRARAEQLFQQACEGGSSPGCLNLGLAAAARDDNVRAFSLYERSCNGGWAAGCHQVAVSYQEGEGIAKDITKAVAFYTQACDDEYVESCTVAANLFLAGEVVARDLDTALRFYGKAMQIYTSSCQAGNQNDCTESGRMGTRIAILSADQQTGRPPAPPPAIK